MVESSIAVEDAVENRGLYRFLSRMFEGGLDTIDHNRTVEPPKQFRTKRLKIPTCVSMRDRVRQGLPITFFYRRGSSIYIHTYTYIYMLWCYYLGQVWPFEVLLSGPSLFFTKHCLSKKHYKIGISAFFVVKNCARKFEVLLSGPSWPFLSCSQLGPDNNTYLPR